MVLYPNKLPESERVCSGICNSLSKSRDKNTLLPGKNHHSLPKNYPAVVCPLLRGNATTTAG